MGNDFLLQNKCVIDIARQMVCVDGKEMKCSSERNLTYLFRLKELETTVVPHLELGFPGYVHAQDNAILPRYSIIEPNDSVYSKGLLLAKAVVVSSLLSELYLENIMIYLQSQVQIVVILILFSIKSILEIALFQT